MKLKEISLDVPSAVKLKGIDKKLYAYRIGEGTDKERVVISNKVLSKRRFEGYYKRRWVVEGLEDYMVRHMPKVYWRLLCMLEVIEDTVSILWRYAPFLVQGL